MNSELTNMQRNQLEALAEEYAERKRIGDSVSIADYVAKYPKLADDIRELFPVVAMLDQAAPPRVQESVNGIEPGARLGEYHLLRVIGRGGMGVVYEAEHITLGSIAAIKVLPTSRNSTKGRARFQREASAAARMHHPNIVRVFDFGYHGDSLYYVMPLIEGWGLNRLIGNHVGISGEKADVNSLQPTRYDLATKSTRPNSGPDDPRNSSDDSGEETEKQTDSFSADRTYRSSSSSRPDDLWSWVARLGSQAANALDYAHSLGVVHRDVKPGNLMVDADNHVYITDFGLAKVMDEHSLTGTGDMLGTLRYMPPEAFAGKADQRSDIYGLGMTLYELLADRPALLEDERGTLMTAITEGRVAKLQTLVPGVPRDLQTVIHKAIDVDPAARYQSASAFQDDLQRFVSGQPVQARRSTWAYRTSRWISRNRTVASLTAMIFVSLVAGLIVSSIGWSRALTAEADATKLAKKEVKARELAQAETAAKESALRAKNIALDEKNVALESEKREREFAQAIVEFTRNDLLALTTKQGQHRFDNSADFGQRGKIKTFQDLLDRAARRLESKSDLDPKVEAELSQMIGISYRIDGHFDKAISLLENAAQLFAKIQNHSDEISSLNSLAVALSANRRMSEAAEYYQKAIDLASRNTPSEYGMPIVLKRNYSAVLADLEKFDEAIRLARESLAESQEKVAHDPYYVSLAMYNLGDILQRAGKPGEAMSQLENALKIQKDAFTDQHPYVWDTLSAIALNHNELGNFDDAIEFGKQVVALKQNSLDPGHYSTAVSMCDLAVILRTAGELEQACTWGKKSVSALTNAIGADSIDTIIATNNLGFVYFRLNKIDEAIEEFARARLSIGAQTENKGLALNVRYNLGFVLANAKRFDESIEVYLEAYQLAGEIRGPFHPKTMKIARTLATVYADTKRFTEAISLRREIVDLSKSNLEPDAPELAAAIEALEKTIAQAADAIESERDEN